MRIDPAKGFAVLAVVFGALFAVVTPPLQVPDEQRHLTRIYSLSEGHVFPDATDPAVGTRIPRDVDEMQHRLAPGLAYDPDLRQDLGVLREELGRPLDPDDRVFRPIASLYSPLAYLAPAAGVALLRGVDAAPVWYVYGGRLLNLALYVALVFVAIRAAPAGRFVFAVLGLLPMALFEAASLAADPVTTGLGFLWIALVLRARDRPGPMGRRELGALLAASAALGLAKPGYWPLVALVAAIPGERFGSARARWGAALGVVAIGLVPNLLWGMALASYGTPQGAPGVDPTEQLRLVVADPLGFVATLARSFATVGPLWLLSFVGILGHLDVLLPAPVYLLAAPLLVSVAVLDGGPRRPFTPAFRASLLGLGVALLLAVLVIGYLSWNRPGAPVIQGVQGRYMLPFAPLLFLWPLRTRRPDWVARVEPVWWAACALGAATAVAAVASRYYGPV